MEREVKVTNLRTKPSALILGQSKGRLTRMERLNTRLVFQTFASRSLDRICRWGLVNFGARWVDICTKNLRYIHGLERIPAMNNIGSFVLATNHRSYFDLYVASMVLIKAGLRNRMLYPVRSKFFYDNPLGLVVNGIMSFGSMYPPIFRERKRLILNRTGLQEIAWFMKNRDMCVGIHPEGTRNKLDNPYELLPPQAGVGQLIQSCQVPVIPAFINGLSNDFPKQVASNFSKTGEPIILVFGEPLDFSEHYEKKGRPIQKEIAKQTLTKIAELGEEERAIRKNLKIGT